MKMKTKYKLIKYILLHRASLILNSTFLTMLLHRFHPDWVQIIIDAGTFCGIILLALDKETK